MTLARSWEGGKEEAHGESIIQITQGINEGWIPAAIALEEKAKYTHSLRVQRASQSLSGSIHISRMYLKSFQVNFWLGARKA